MTNPRDMDWRRFVHPAHLSNGVFDLQPPSWASDALDDATTNEAIELEGEQVNNDT